MADKKPNILVIWGDDIGITNLSCYSNGLMSYRTPNIDRIAKEGMMFTDSYGEQSCTAGRSSFITGQSAYRTGLSKVGIPAAPVGLQAETVTIAELFKNHGYATGQWPFLSFSATSGSPAIARKVGSQLHGKTFKNQK
jgi:arylsulfatase A-like enzyme